MRNSPITNPNHAAPPTGGGCPTAQSPSKIYKNLYNNQLRIDSFQKICAARSITLLQIIHQLLLILVAR